MLQNVVSLVVQKGCHIEHMDVKFEFLNGNIQETIFVEQPPGFIQPGEEHKVCRLRKALYDIC